jgi:hypothetical protein
MSARAIVAVLSAALIVFVVAGASLAAWQSRGVVVCEAAREQGNPLMAQDGAGGAIVVWEDDRNADWNIYAQRIDGAGMPLWAPDGIAIATASGEEELLQVVAGSSGEAIVLWKRSSNIYAQKIDASGALQWNGSEGIEIYTIAEAISALMVSDGAGGAIVAFIAYTMGSDNIYAQRLDHHGSEAWALGGVMITGGAGDESQICMASDGAGGAVVGFVSGSPPNVGVQRVMASGATWIGGAVPVGPTMVARTNPAIASDGDGGAIVAWQQDNIASIDIAAQRVDASGALAWASGGTFLCGATDDQTDPEIIEDGSGGAVVIWHDQREGSGMLHGQKVDAYGQTIWTSDGVPVYERTHDALNHCLLPAGPGGVLVVWIEPAGPELRGQLMNITGGTDWDHHAGVEVLRGDLGYGEYGAASDGAGGLIAALADFRSESESNDILAQGINRLGRISAPEPRILEVSDVPGDQGGKLRILVERSDRDSIDLFTGETASYGVWQRIDDEEALALRSEGPAETSDSFVPGIPLLLSKGRRFIEAAPAGILPEGSWEYVGGFEATQSDEYVYRATTVADSSSEGPHYSVYLITAHSSDPLVWFASAPDSGFSVDNLPPGAPEGLAGEQSFDPVGLDLTWDANEENDLSHYAVYRGTSEGFVPGAGNLVAAPDDAGWFDAEWRWDSGYYYKVAAIDLHDNESGHALLRPDDVTGAGQPRVPEASYLAQNYPNPFNPVTKIAFGLKEGVSLQLRIYDASGRLVRTLVDGPRPAGHYTELWDGRDERGTAVASGIYFCRLDAAPFSETRKIVLLK